MDEDLVLKVSSFDKFSPGGVGSRFKRRVVVLTPRFLRYHSGTLEKRGPEKGCIDLKTVNVIEKVLDGTFHGPAFQVRHGDKTLYLVAGNTSETEEWIDLLRQYCMDSPSLHSRHHPGIFVKNKWSCCDHRSKYSVGCHPTFSNRDNHVQPKTPPIYESLATSSVYKTLPTISDDYESVPSPSHYESLSMPSVHEVQEARPTPSIFETLPMPSVYEAPFDYETVPRRFSSETVTYLRPPVFDLYSTHTAPLPSSLATFWKEKIGNVAGFHPYLPNNQVNEVMSKYLSSDGNYLVRVSTTAHDQLNLTVSGGGRLWNSKIYYSAGGTGFSFFEGHSYPSLQALLEACHSIPIPCDHPLGPKTLSLLHPIPVDPLTQKGHEEMLHQGGESSSDGRVSSDEESSEEETEEDFIKMITEAFGCGEEIARRLAHAMLVGPPGSGKSSLMDRLLQRLKREFDISTDVTEDIVSVEVRLEEKQSTFHAAVVIAGEWKEFEFNESLFSHIALKEGVVQPDSHVTTPDTQAKIPSHPAETIELSANEATLPPLKSPESSTSAADLPSSPRKENRATPLHFFTPKKPVLNQSMIVYLKKKYGSYKQFKKFLERGFSLYLRDTGGQVEFQEMLPLLIFGPSIFLFVFRLDLPFKSRFEVTYRQKDGIFNDYVSSITIEEALLQCLATVDVIRHTDKHGFETRQPYVFIVGTHKDELRKKFPATERKICSMNLYLDALLKKHGFNDLVSYAGNDPKHVMYTVDNTSEDEEDFDLIRSRINAVITSRDEFIIQYPINYLLFCLDLQNVRQDIVSLREFKTRARKFGIQGVQQVSKLLHFLCNRIGIIQHFDKDGVRHIVINQPPFLYRKVSELVIETFKGKTLCAEEREDLDKGILSLKAAESIIGRESQISTQELLDLLVQLRIVAPFKDGKYFIPCILNHLPEASGEAVNDNIVAPLYIRFGCNYCPKGLFGVLVTHFMRPENDSSSLTFQFSQDRVSKDHVSFEVESAGDVLDWLSLKVVGCSYLEVTFDPEERDPSSIAAVCTVICKVINSYISKSFVDLHYNAQLVHHEMCLRCEKCSELHKVLSSNKIRCQRKKLDIPSKGTYWFTDCEGPTPELVESSLQPSISSAAAQSQVQMPPEFISPTPTEHPVGFSEEHAICQKIHEVSATTLSLSRVFEYFYNKVSQADLVDVGVRLGLNYVMLVDMKGRDNFLSSMLTAWLRKDAHVEEDPSWRSLCQALRECGLNGTADEIGKLLKLL